MLQGSGEVTVDPVGLQERRRETVLEADQHHLGSGNVGHDRIVTVLLCAGFGGQVCGEPAQERGVMPLETRGTAGDGQHQVLGEVIVLIEHDHQLVVVVSAHDR
ncbi:hypothetical protein [Rudaeicoccus suwonensis]|uniref:Uncharacterized protein n=1 Tax=Rudaeicoccus suwonensis TaxID=657409 RepID=A0A561DVK6_9MICO|nr:hypothetical protein [Rudaeicoccus suwonensis]TWE07396.1 hypothetical protein BKA23_3409 [Rudaeicoccus suwonensis]